MFDRLIALIDESNYNKIKQQKILLVGVGGVGSYALETLVRNGFTNITIIDYDKIDITNLNRQLITNNQNIGHSKVIAGILRSKSINPDILIDGIENKLTETNIEEILALNFDYVIDACDDINIKFLLMVKKEQYKYQLISSMGTAKKLDPTKLKITTLDKTTNDPLARILRKKVKDAKIKYKINVVSSDEVPLPIKTLGSANLVPSVAGILCVSYIINDLIKK
ncbi:MAG: tRNA threonylcarbamoyladenosine dehydratase [Bacilli bacterium]|jgi:tRNA A37 threonylcarbamoyladenosine dehydratase|nr:tRNA threonylcarbamoyladenosine dehydratase [Bacilli bacterium]